MWHAWRTDFYSETQFLNLNNIFFIIIIEMEIVVALISHMQTIYYLLWAYCVCVSSYLY